MLRVLGCLDAKGHRVKTGREFTLRAKDPDVADPHKALYLPRADEDLS